LCKNIGHVLFKLLKHLVHVGVVGIHTVIVSASNYREKDGAKEKKRSAPKPQAFSPPYTHHPTPPLTTPTLPPKPASTLAPITCHGHGHQESDEDGCEPHFFLENAKNMAAAAAAVLLAKRRGTTHPPL